MLRCTINIFIYKTRRHIMCVRINSWFKKIWQNIRQDPIEAYLSQSKDVVDLEHRMRTVTHRMINKNFYGGNNG